MERRVTNAILLFAAALAACSTSDIPEDKAPTAARSWRDPQPEVGPPAGQPSGPEYVARVAIDRAHAEGRGRDQLAHPEYLALTAPWVAATLASGGADTRIGHDPYRVAWAGSRGTVEDVEFPNRYGAKLRGRFFGPLEGGTGLPVVLFVPGRFAPYAGSPFTGFANYENILQSLAEAGYVVFAVGPQGQDGSEWFEPPHPQCEAGSWQEPQEFGLRELGACAGHEGPSQPHEGDYAAVYGASPDDRPAALAQGQLELPVALEQRADGYAEFETRFVFAALDAADYLLSKENPWRDRIDPRRLAIVGHSAGGHAAMIVGNGDPRRRFSAAVSLDSFGFPPDTVKPTIPTLVQMAERQNEFGPFDTSPPNHLWPPYRVYRRFVAEGVDAMLLAFRGSTHHEWSYVPHALLNPVSPLQNASSKGGQVGLYYTLSWLDRRLRPDREVDAARRLLAGQFDGSADASSIGAGTWDWLAQRNVPYRVEGENVADHLSVLFLSQYAFDGLACDDVQAGCP